MDNVADTPQVARMKRTRERIIDVIRMLTQQEEQMRGSLIEISAAIDDEERR